jgi:hypothetical protein
MAAPASSPAGRSRGDSGVTFPRAQDSAPPGELVDLQDGNRRHLVLFDCEHGGVDTQVLHAAQNEVAVLVIGDVAEEARLFPHYRQRGQHVRGRTSGLHAEDRGIYQALVEAWADEEQVDRGEADAHHHTRRGGPRRCGSLAPALGSGAG